MTDVMCVVLLTIAVILLVALTWLVGRIAWHIEDAAKSKHPVRTFTAEKPTPAAYATVREVKRRK